MTENEAIERIRTGICNERGTQRFCKDSCMYGIDKCAYSMAIQALEEIPRYRDLGTVDELAEIQVQYYHLLHQVKEFEAIGTIEELHELKEKSVAKKVIPYHPWGGKCPSCSVIFTSRLTQYCGNCGQKLDWQ